jgi:hypothetical protein
MKKLLSITLLAIFSLASVLLNLSCNGTPQNNGGTLQNNTVGSNAVNGNAVPDNTDQFTKTSVAEVCSGSPSEKQGKIRAKIKENIEGDDRLNYQYEKRFDFEPVMETNGDATLYIWGSIFIYDPKQDLDNLHKKYKDYFKKGCVAKVVFTPPPTPPPGVTTTILRNFEYTTLCEAPNQICYGICQPDCDR